jgi:hypothetical protein
MDGYHAVAAFGTNALLVRVLRQCEATRKRTVETLDPVHLRGVVALLLLALDRRA